MRQTFDEFIKTNFPTSAKADISYIRIGWDNREAQMQREIDALSVPPPLAVAESYTPVFVPEPDAAPSDEGTKEVFVVDGVQAAEDGVLIVADGIEQSGDVAAKAE